MTMEIEIFDLHVLKSEKHGNMMIFHFTNCSRLPVGKPTCPISKLKLFLSQEFALSGEESAPSPTKSGPKFPAGCSGSVIMWDYLCHDQTFKHFGRYIYIYIYISLFIHLLIF